MTFSSIGVVFFINWLVIFFIFLPVGIKVPKKQKLGHANSAPYKTYLLIKIMSSFLVALFTTFCSIKFIKFNYF